MDTQIQKIIQKSEQLSIPGTRELIYVSIPEQKLYLYRENELHKTYTVSTSLKPPSEVEDSFGTPRGLHRVEMKIGENEKAGIVFIGRVSTEKYFWEYPDEIQEKNLITSRILWLKGLEPGKNSGDGIDSFARYIYIHGTNHEEKLGTPATAGCVVLSNEDVIRLYDQMPGGTLVYIDDE